VDARARTGYKLAVRRHPLDDHGSFAWLAHPDEPMQRGSTAIALDGGGCLLVDPLDAPGLDDALAPLGEVRGVCLLLNRHGRDAEQLAERYAVPIVVPQVLAGRGQPLRLPGVQERTVWRRFGWKEAALWLPERGLLVTADALGTAPYFRASPDERLAVHPLLRLFPPRLSLVAISPAAIAVGHGPPVTDGAAEALLEALRTARTRLPAAWWRGLRLSIAARRHSR
jgi:hypothetical protein